VAGSTSVVWQANDSSLTNSGTDGTVNSLAYDNFNSYLSGERLALFDRRRRGREFHSRARQYRPARRPVRSGRNCSAQTPPQVEKLTHRKPASRSRSANVFADRDLVACRRGRTPRRKISLASDLDMAIPDNLKIGAETGQFRVILADIGLLRPLWHNDCTLGGMDHSHDPMTKGDFR